MTDFGVAFATPGSYLFGHMKTMRTLLVFAGTFFAAAFVSGQAIDLYGVVKLYDVTQTGNSAPTPGATPYGFNAFADGSGISGVYTVTYPGGTATPNPKTLTNEIDGSSFEDGFAYADIAAVNAAYHNGLYSMAIPNGGTAQSVSGLNMTGDIYPDAPMITGGTWSGGKLLLDPTINNTINFTAFTLSSGSFGAGDKIFLSSEDDYDAASSTAVTSFVINSGVLTAGQTYNFELVFVNAVYLDTTTLTSSGGNIGLAGYVTIVNFDIQAIPEPSTYAAIFGGLALVGVALRRRRQVIA